MTVRLAPVFAVLGAALIVSVSGSLTAANSVPVTHIGLSQTAIAANDLAPAACSAINLSGTISGGGILAGGLGNDLIRGSAGAHTITGGAGDDCIVAGAGDDTIDGGPGNDVCIGGTGTNTFVNCESTP